MHGIDGQQSLLEPELAQQSLDRRDFVGLFVEVEMRQHQSSVRCKGTENMPSLAVAENCRSLDATPYRVHGNLPLALRSGPLVKDGGMASDTCSTELASNCRMMLRIVV
jgi:hypothetical protein